MQGQTGSSSLAYPRPIQAAVRVEQGQDAPADVLAGSASLGGQFAPPSLTRTGRCSYRYDLQDGQAGQLPNPSTFGAPLPVRPPGEAMRGLHPARVAADPCGTATNGVTPRSQLSTYKGERRGPTGSAWRAGGLAVAALDHLQRQVP
jgi:hypothetical protein